MKKDKEKKSIEICLLCNQEIYLDIDDYVNVIDYRKGRFHMEGFYHNRCYLHRIKNNTTMKNKILESMAVDLYTKANKLLKDSGVDSEDKVYVIK